MTWSNVAPRTPVGWFFLGLIEFLLVTVVLGAVIPRSWPAAVQGGVALAAFAGLVAFNLWLQRRTSARR
jgi:hypothetical protein